jgi:dCMP deaminase
MLQAHVTATMSTCDRGPELLLDPGRHGVGAVIVRDRRVIAGGYNGSPPGQPHCNDPENYLECRTCGTRFEGEVEGFVPGRGSRAVCPTCDAGTFVLEGHGGHIISDGHCVRTIHSEMNALLQCGLDGVSPEGASIFCTASPCFDCTKAIIRARIREVYFGQAYDSRYGLSGTVENLLEEAGVVVSMCLLTISEDGTLTPGD